MKTIQSWFVEIIVVAACAFTASKPTYADTYKMFPPLISDGGYFFYSMDDSGDVTFFNPVFGYYTFHYGVSTGVALPTAPSFADDQGTPCTPAVPPGGSVKHGVCNNGRDAFTGFLAPIAVQIYPGLYAGSYPSITIIEPKHFGDGFIFINSNGDVVIDDDFTDDWYFFQDTSVPEPSSVFLLGTGALGLLTEIRRLHRS